MASGFERKTAKRGNAWEQVGDIAADVKTHFRTHGFKSAHESLFARKNQVLVYLSGDLTGGGIPNADGVGSGFDLGPGEIEGNLHTKVHQRTDVSLVIHEVHEEVVEAPHDAR